MTIDFDYLANISDMIPSPGSSWGCYFDGQRLALVGFAMATHPDLVEVNPGDFQRRRSPVIFYAALLNGVSMTRATKIFDQIASALGEQFLTLIMKGSLGHNEVFARHLRREKKHGVRLFRDGTGRYYDDAEVILSVADHRAEGKIRLAPEFENQPERVLLDEEIALIDPTVPLSPLAEAFVFGLGEWSCKGERKKYHAKFVNLRITR